MTTIPNNNVKKIKYVLQNLGLNNLEMEVFLANFELGAAPASKIANKITKNRISVYEALKRLQKKGLVKIRFRQNTRIKYFEVENMQVVEESLKESKQKLEDSLVELKKIIPDLNKLFIGKHEQPAVLFYAGKEGIKRALMDTLEQKPKEILSFASAEALEEGFKNNFLQEYWHKRTALKIPSSGIMPKTPTALTNFTPAKNLKELRRIKFIPKEFYDFVDEIDIYGNNISIISFEKGNEHAVIVRSKSIAQGLTAIYKLIWSMPFN